MNRISSVTTQHTPAEDGFDLDVTVIQSGPQVTALAASEGGCKATCGSDACVSSGA